MGLDVILESDPSELELPPETEREVYYVLREALTNVTRHSHASKVQIHIAQRDGNLNGTMIDNGVGFDHEHCRTDGGLGLTGMEQRIEKVGGRLLVKSSPGNGTKLSFDVPLKHSTPLLLQE
jgi:signal transduction histidine kinase